MYEITPAWRRTLLVGTRAKLPVAVLAWFVRNRTRCRYLIGSNNNADGSVAVTFARQQSRLAGRPGRKIVHQGNSPILACSVFASVAGSAGAVWASDRTTPAAPREPRSVGGELVRVNLKLLRQLDQRIPTLHSSRATYGITPLNTVL